MEDADKTLMERWPELQEAGNLTRKINEYEDALKDMYTARKHIILFLRRNGISYKAIASATQVSTQTIYKNVQESIKKRKARGARELENHKPELHAMTVENA